MTATPSTLIDTTVRSDARRLGYDGPCHPREDGEGLIVIYRETPLRTMPPGVYRELVITVPEGSFELDLTAAREMLIEAFRFMPEADRDAVRAALAPVGRKVAA